MISRLENSLIQDTTFIYGYSYHGGTYARSKEAYQSFAIVQEDKQLSGLKVLATENERAKKFGFTKLNLIVLNQRFRLGMRNNLMTKTKQILITCSSIPSRVSRGSSCSRY
jgi:hypothetical protein